MMNQRTALAAVSFARQQTYSMTPGLDDDSKLITLWLHGKSRHTQRIYLRHVIDFRAFAAKSLATVTLGDLQDYSDELERRGDLKPSSRVRILSSLKSLFSFANRIGLLPFNVGAALRLPALRDDLAARIVDEATIQRILALETHPRNSALLTLLYAGGLRAEEAANLKWRDLVASAGSGQVTVFGKGGKTRSILLPERAWSKLQELRGEAGPEGWVFRSRKHGRHVSTAQIWRIVKASAKKAGAGEALSPHWFRHAHASHALDRGAPAHVVMTTLGHSSLSVTSRYTHARPNDSSGRYLAL